MGREAALGIPVCLPSKWILSVMFGAFILWRHDAEAVWAAMGSILNGGLSPVLKRILNQERPVSTARSDPGMPSSHAQSIFFIITFIILSNYPGCESPDKVSPNWCNSLYGSVSLDASNMSCKDQDASSFVWDLADDPI